MNEIYYCKIKNNSGADVFIVDLGLTIVDAGERTLTDLFTYEQVSNSRDLRSLVTAGTLIVNDGTSDLNSTHGLEWLTPENVHLLHTEYYSKTELQTSGQSQIHWENITNPPSFGSMHWVEPVLYRVTTIGPSGNATPTMGDVFVDTDDQKYYKWNGSTWVDSGAASTGNLVINLSDPQEGVFRFNGTAWVDTYTPADNDAVLVNDDGDGQAAQYVYDLPTTEWKKIGDLDFNGHLDGGASKHDATEIDVEGTYAKLGAPTNLETVISNISNLFDNMALSASGGVLYHYDSSRGKYVSVDRRCYAYGKHGAAKDEYLAFYLSNLKSNNSGLRVRRNAVITALSCQLSSSGTCTIHIRKNGNAANIASLTVSAAVGNHTNALNVNVVEGDYLQCYVENTANVSNPVIELEIGWR